MQNWLQARLTHIPSHAIPPCAAVADTTTNAFEALPQALAHKQWAPVIIARGILPARVGRVRDMVWERCTVLLYIYSESMLPTHPSSKTNIRGTRVCVLPTLPFLPRT